MRWAYVAGAAVIAATFIADLYFSINYRIAANVSLVFIAAFTTFFAALYGVRSNWQGNRIGRIFFAKSVVLPLVLWQIVLSVWWDTEYPFRQQIRFVIYTLGGVAFITMIVSLWNEQRRDRRNNFL